MRNGWQPARHFARPFDLGLRPVGVQAAGSCSLISQTRSRSGEGVGRLSVLPNGWEGWHIGQQQGPVPRISPPPEFSEDYHLIITFHGERDVSVPLSVVDIQLIPGSTVLRFGRLENNFTQGADLVIPGGSIRVPVNAAS